MASRQWTLDTALSLHNTSRCVCVWVGGGGGVGGWMRKEGESGIKTMDTRHSLVTPQHFQVCVCVGRGGRQVCVYVSVQCVCVCMYACM